VNVNECGVDEVEVRQKELWTVIWQCDLGKVRTKEKAKNGSVRVPDGGDFLSDVERAGKNERSLK